MPIAYTTPEVRQAQRISAVISAAQIGQFVYLDLGGTTKGVAKVTDKAVRRGKGGYSKISVLFQNGTSTTVDFKSSDLKDARKATKKELATFGDTAPSLPEEIALFIKMAFSAADLRAAKGRAVLLLHPDRTGDPKTAARLQKALQGYEILKTLIPGE